MTDEHQSLFSLMEPGAMPGYQNRAMVSIAISLKRIADVLEGSPSKEGLVQHLGNVLSDSIFNATRRI